MTLHKDSLAEKAAEVAETALSNRPISRYYMRVDGSERYVRDQISTFTSPRFQRDFILALRVAMLNSMEKHRLTCPHKPCGREDHYEKLKFALLDELDARTPSGQYVDEIPKAQLLVLELRLKELLDAVNDGNERQLEAAGVVVDSLEGLKELLYDQHTKTTNTGAMIAKYVGLKVADKAVETAVAIPFLADVGRAFGINLG